MSGMKRNILLNPGPATTTDTVKSALVVPDICPREKEFGTVLREVREGLCSVAGAGDDHTCVLIGGSGTAMMDAVLNSAVPPDGRVLIVNNGAYGERMAKIARAYRLPHSELVLPWDKAVSPDTVRRALAEKPGYTHVAVIHHETTTGLLNPLREIGEAAHEASCRVIVDAISSFAGMRIDVKSDHADFLVSTSNKCIQGMAGVSFVIARRPDVSAMGNWPPRSFYLNLHQHYVHLEERGETAFTPPVQVVYALRQAIREFFDEGADNRYARYRRNWEVLVEGLKRMGLKRYAEDQPQSRILVTILEPEDPRYDFEKVHNRLYDEGITIYPGKLAGEHTFRLSIMGAITPDDITLALEKLRQAFLELGVTFN